MFVNKLFTHLTYAKSKECFNVKSSIYYFHLKTKILTDFQIWIIVHLKKRLWQRRFPVKFVEFLRTPFFIEHLWATASVYGRIAGQKWSFPLRISLVNFSNFFSEILNGKLHFLCNQISYAVFQKFS